MQPQKPPSRLPWQFWIVTAIAFINAISFTIVIPLLYPYAKALELSDFAASLLVTAFALSQFIATPILGRMSDRLGRKPLLVMCLAGTAIANFVASFTSVAWLLYLARIFDGLTGGNTSIARAVISDITPANLRPKAFGIFSATFRLGFVVGPALSYVAQQLPTLPGISSLGMSFFVGAAIALVATLVTFFFLPETQSDVQPFSLRWDDFGFGKIAKSATRPLLGRVFVLSFFSGATFTIFTFAFQPFFLNVLQQDAKMLAIVFAMLGMTGFSAQVFALEPLRQRFNIVDLLWLMLFVRGILFLLFPVSTNLALFFVEIVIFGAVNSFPLPLIDSILSLNSGDREQGEILGINISYISISNAIGPAISGLLVGLGYRFPFVITGFLTLLTAWFAFSLKSRLKCEQSN